MILGGEADCRRRCFKAEKKQGRLAFQIPVRLHIPFVFPLISAVLGRRNRSFCIGSLPHWMFDILTPIVDQMLIEEFHPSM